jgi:TatD DNase family protein
MNLIDTHTHLQFKAFEETVDDVIQTAKDSGIDKMIIVGTNLDTSKKAIALAEKHVGLFASVGLHPHHIFALTTNNEYMVNTFLRSVEELVKNPKVIAIGETGIDKHHYQKTHYQNYSVSDEFVSLQKICFREQINLAIEYKKTLIIHNREAASELLQVLEENWHPFLQGRSVLHCCEPEEALLEFAINNRIFIGVDGDVTYDKAKQAFVKKIPLDLLVLETDSPYFIPEPLKSEGTSLNQPANLEIIAQIIANLKNEPIENVRKMSSTNALTLFKL